MSEIYKRGRKLTEEDQKDIKEIYRWLKIVERNKTSEEWYMNAALVELMHRIETYLAKIGYVTYD